MMLAIKAILPALVPFIFLLASTTGQNLQVQSLQIWNSSNCNGSVPIFNETNSSTLTVIGTAFYYRVNGLWTLQHCNSSAANANCTKRDILSGVGTGCNPLTAVNGFRTFQLNRLGDAQQNKQELVLFPGADFTGTATTLTSDRNFTNNPLPVGSFFFTGRWNWTLYTGTDYQGANCHLATSSVGSQGWGFTFERNYNRQVRTIRAGCHTSPSSSDLVKSSSSLIMILAMLVGAKMHFV